MRKRALTLSLIFLLTAQVAPAIAADDWVDDEHVNGFYKKGIIRTPDDYETMPQDMAPGDMSPSPNSQYGGMPDQFGGGSSMQMGDQFGSQQFGSQQFGSQSGAQPMGNQRFGNRMPPPQNAAPPAQSKSFLGKLGKSIINAPKAMLGGADDLFDDPGFWQSAGAVAGMGANAYLNYKRGPYYGGYNPYGYGSPYGSVNPFGFGYNPYGSIYGNPYGGIYGNPYGGVLGSGIFGNPYGRVLGNPYGGIGGIGVPYGAYGGSIGTPIPGGVSANPNNFISPYGLGAINPYGMGTPFGGGYGLGGLGGLGGFGGFGGINFR